MRRLAIRYGWQLWTTGLILDGHSAADDIIMTYPYCVPQRQYMMEMVTVQFASACLGVPLHPLLQLNWHSPTPLNPPVLGLPKTYVFSHIVSLRTRRYTENVSDSERVRLTMTTMLVISPDSSALALLQTTTPPAWTVLHAGDGISGIDLVQRLRGQVRLVVLDLALPDLDARTVCLRIREHAPALPILPLTRDGQHVASLADLGCLPPVMHPFTLDDLRSLLYTAMTTTPPPLTASGIPDLVLEQSRVIERMARMQRSRPVIIVHTVAPIHRAGVAKLLEAAADVRQTLHPAGLRLLLPHLRCTAIIADVSSCDAIQPIAASFGVPLLLLAESVAQARASDHQGIAGIL